MTDDGWEGVGDIPSGKSDPKDKFTVIQGGKDHDAKRAEIRKDIKDFCAGHRKHWHNPSGAAELIERAVFAELPKHEIDTLIEWCGPGQSSITSKGNLNQYYKDAVVKLKNAKKQERLVSGDWKAMLQQDANGRGYLSNQHNTKLFLTWDERFAGHFRYDEFKAQISVMGRPSWLHEHILGKNGSCPLSDIIVSAIIDQLQGSGLTTIRRHDVDAALNIVAMEQKYNSLTNWLDNLQWDGVKRLNSWLVKYCGVKNILYSRLVARWWILSAVARAYDPGCKVDHVLLLESPQGYKKSTLWMTVARRPEWYLEYTEDLNTADGRKQLRGRWIVALPELAAMGRKEVQHVKAFITRQMENIRDIYEKYHHDHARNFVLCGDTNDDKYFSDTTGNRRYWPLRCKRIDISGLETVMDQIWAEAVVAYKEGHVWWPHVDSKIDEVRHVCMKFERYQNIATGIRFKADPWQALVGEWIYRGKSEGREVGKLPGPSKLCQMILGMSGKDVGQHDAERMGKIMKRLGYVNQTVWIDRRAVEGFRKK